MKTLPLIVIALIASAVTAAEWTLIPGTDDMGDIITLETDGNRLYAGAENGVYISDDDGDAWRLTDMTHFVSAMAISDDAVYAFASEHGMFRSDDCGETWNAKNNGLHKIDDRTGEIRLPYIHQILVASSGMLIAVGYHFGTYLSRDRSETWHYPFEEWVFDRPPVSTYIAWDTWSMTEFDGYLWSACRFGFHQLYRTADEGDTWESLPNWAASRRALSDYGQALDWAVHNDQLYVAAGKGFARWDEGELAWDDLSRGLPDEPWMNNLTHNRGRIFAGVRNRGVWMFDEPSETWVPVGLQEFLILDIVSHQSQLYAAVRYDNWAPVGLYRASISIINPYGKAATTWGALKRP